MRAEARLDASRHLVPVASHVSFRVCRLLGGRAAANIAGLVGIGIAEPGVTPSPAADPRAPPRQSL